MAQLLLQQGKVLDALKYFEQAAELSRTEGEIVNALSYAEATRTQLEVRSNVRCLMEASQANQHSHHRCKRSTHNSPAAFKGKVLVLVEACDEGTDDSNMRPSGHRAHSTSPFCIEAPSFASSSSLSRAPEHAYCSYSLCWGDCSAYCNSISVARIVRRPLIIHEPHSPVVPVSCNEVNHE